MQNNCLWYDRLQSEKGLAELSHFEHASELEGVLQLRCQFDWVSQRNVVLGMENVTPEVLQVLHPLKPADSNTSPASVYIRAHNDASVPEDCIPSRRCGTVSSLHHKTAVKLLGHRLIDGIGGGGWNEDITWHAEHLIMRDFIACTGLFTSLTHSVTHSTLTHSLIRRPAQTLTQLT